MKKMQSLGKSLSKNEQKNVVGGVKPFFQATCVCWNGPNEYTCSFSCAAAQAACSDPSICALSGGLEGALITCSTC